MEEHILGMLRRMSDDQLHETLDIAEALSKKDAFEYSSHDRTPDFTSSTPSHLWAMRQHKMEDKEKIRRIAAAVQSELSERTVRQARSDRMAERHDINRANKEIVNNSQTSIQPPRRLRTTSRC